MAEAARLKRKSFFVDEQLLAQAKKVLGVETDAEVIRLSVERIAEMGKLWRFMDASKGTVKRGSFRRT